MKAFIETILRPLKKSRPISFAALGLLAVGCVAFAASYAGSARDQNPSSPSNHTAVLHKYIGLHDLYVPEIYARDMVFGMTNGSITDGFIETYYPGSEPLPDAECCSHPKWSLKRLRTSFFDLDQIPEPFRTTGPTKFLEGRLSSSQAYQVDGEQYGLIHQEQPENPNKVHKMHNEFWIERKGGKLVSFIECDGDAPYPRCTHYFRDNTFSYNVRFAKIYLPEWRLIHDNVLALMGSFKSKEAARAFLAAHLSKTKATEGGKTP